MCLDELNEDIDLGYLEQFLRAFDFKAIISGSSQPQITRQGLTKVLVPVRSRAEQRAIASNLGKLRQLENLYRKQLSALDDLVKSQFVEMFGDQKENDRRLPQRRLGEVAFVGSSRRVFKEDLVEEGVPFLRGTEVGAYGQGRKNTPALFISNEHYERLVADSGKPEPGDLLLPSICPDGQIWEVDTEKPFYFKDGRVLWVKPDKQRLNSTFLRFAMNNRFESDYGSLASGTTFAELKIVALKRMLVSLPPLALQQQFADFVAEVDKLAFDCYRESVCCSVLFSSMSASLLCT